MKARKEEYEPIDYSQAGVEHDDFTLLILTAVVIIVFAIGMFIGINWPS